MTATAVRPEWGAVPEQVRTYIEARLGVAVSEAEMCGGGFTPGLAARLLLADGSRVFVKGIPDEHPMRSVYQAEARITEALPETAPGPRVLWSAPSGQEHGWSLLCLEDLPDGNPDVSPGSPDLRAVVDTLLRMRESLTPSPIPEAPQMADVHGSYLCGWAQLAEDVPADLDPWARRNLGRLAEIEKGWLRPAHGSTLTHGDLRPDNMVMRGGEAVVIDWSYLSQAADWCDAVSLVPHLILAGHDPGSAEAVVAPLLESVPDGGAVTAFAAAFGGYWERSSRSPAPPNVPHLRGYQARAAGAARVWIAHRTGWV
ncbi:phosphotransferase family protein [Streptomyces sp. NPDC056549]|uniref:phosphotransferase family protein n=1 Tax=Streptomyces sp. NPDC056549 TaxID=3345864 RepID=UPI0036BBDFA3